MFARIQMLGLLMTLGISAIGQTSNLFYDIGLMIDDSSKQVQPTDADHENGVMDQEERMLEEELNKYQHKLAETEMRLKYQTQVIDSLQNEISMIKAARETDLALMSTKITRLETEREQAGQQPQVVVNQQLGSDSVYAELHNPWSQVNVVSGNPVKHPTEPKLSTAEAQEAYRNGLTRFHQQLYYQAIDDFNTIVYRGLDQDMRASSQYWVGRCYYEKGLYDEAIEALEQVQRFHTSDKQDDALVLIGLAFKNKSRPEEARLAFQELVNRHPGSEYLTLARRFVQN